jgi:glycosyltransferase involved in cell wall biosynthesis
MTNTSHTKIINNQPVAAGRKVRILLVPGFIVDTYSSIEQSMVELSAKPGPDIEILWLVPDMSSKYNRFSRPENRHKMNEPVWVTHLRQHGIPYVVGNVSKYNLLSNFMLFRDVFRKNRIDAVYTHFGFERFWTAFFGKLFGKVVIWHERWHSLGTRYAFPKQLFYRFFVDEFIAVSEFIKNTLPRGKRVRATIPGTRVNVPIVSDQNEKSERRRKLHIPADAKVVIMVANFRAWKRHMLALEICGQVLQKRDDVFFVFLGDGEVRSPFLAKAKSMGIDNHIMAPGYADNVNDYFAISDIGILTSHYEPFGNVVLEAMRYALPVVSFDKGGPAEMIRHGETGFLAKEADPGEFANRVLELVEDERLCTTLGKKGRQVAQLEYSREAALERVSAWLKDSVLEHRKSLPHSA